MSDGLVWLYKSGEDTWSEVSMLSARGMIDGFARGGSAILVINGGVRVQVPGGHHWDFIEKGSTHPAWRHGQRPEEVETGA